MQTKKPAAENHNYDSVDHCRYLIAWMRGTRTPNFKLIWGQVIGTKRKDYPYLLRSKCWKQYRERAAQSLGDPQLQKLHQLHQEILQLHEKNILTILREFSHTVVNILKAHPGQESEFDMRRIPEPIQSVLFEREKVKSKTTKEVKTLILGLDFQMRNYIKTIPEFAPLLHASALREPRATTILMEHGTPSQKSSLCHYLCEIRTGGLPAQIPEDSILHNKTREAELLAFNERIQTPGTAINHQDLAHMSNKEIEKERSLARQLALTENPKSLTPQERKDFALTDKFTEVTAMLRHSSDHYPSTLIECAKRNPGECALILEYNKSPHLLKVLSQTDPETLPPTIRPFLIKQGKTNPSRETLENQIGL
jgi:hypothetical protein